MQRKAFSHTFPFNEGLRTSFKVSELEQEITPFTGLGLQGNFCSHSVQAKLDVVSDQIIVSDMDRYVRSRSACYSSSVNEMTAIEMHL